MSDDASGRGKRLFPARFWTTPPEGEGPAADLIRAAAAAPTWRERLTGPWQKPEVRLIRVLRSLRAGVTAEAQGVHERADFYFENAGAEFERLCANERIWQALSSKLGAADIRTATARELLLQTHVGFIGAYQNDKPESVDRLLKHAMWAQRAVRFAGMSIEEAAATRTWLRNLEINELQRAGRHQDALTAFERALEAQSPDSFKDTYIQTFYDQTMAALTAGDSDGDKQRNEEVLAAALARFARVFAYVSNRPIAWERLADLYARRVSAFSDELAPGTRIAILQRAVDADPFNVTTQSVDVQTRFVLSAMQEQIARLEQEAAAEGKTLNEKGVSLKNSLMNGFVEARGYLQSQEAAAIQHAARTAWSGRLWIGIGLTESEGWQERALGLMDAIGSALTRGDLNDPAFASTLAGEITARPGLDDFDASAIAARLIELEGRLPQPDGQSDPVVPATVQTSAPLPIAEGARVRGSEDLGDWLFSRQGLITRWSIAAAAVFMVSATVLTGYNSHIESARQALLPRVMTAVGDNDDELVIDLAAQFLSRRPLTSRGDVDQTVEQAYAEALINLFARSPGEPSPSLVRAAERYRQLVGQPQEERQ